MLARAPASPQAMELSLTQIRISYLEWWWFLLSAEPDIHLLSETPKSPYRRLSLCSLPVPKQTDGSLGSCPRRSARHLRDLAAWHRVILMFFPFREGFYSAASRSPVFYAPLRACRRPSSWLRQASPCFCSLSDVPSHKPQPAHGFIEEPVLRLPLKSAGCVCSSAWRWAFELACRPSSAHLCGARNS